MNRWDLIIWGEMCLARWETTKGKDVNFGLIGNGTAFSQVNIHVGLNVLKGGLVKVWGLV